MDAITRLFDAYSLKARVQVIFFVLFPVIISIIAWYPEAKSWGGIAASFLAICGILAFLAIKISSIGNALQRKLYKEWGGAPTTIALRHHGNNAYTIKRYHSWLNTKVPELLMPTIQEETDAPNDADQRYDSAIKFLREHTRDAKKYPLVKIELTNYGFSRNLLAIKYVGVILATISVFINGTLIWFKHLTNIGSDIEKIVEALPQTQTGACLLSLIALFGWLLVTKHWVKTRANSYAISLVAVCDTSKEENQS